MRQVILISGAQGSGKTTLATALEESLRRQYRVYRLKFADPVYRLHNAVLSAARSMNLPVQSPDGTLLQLLGTNWGRATLGENVWVEYARRQIHECLIDPRGVVIIDDLRFPNEMNVWDRSRCCLIRLECDESTRRLRAAKWREDTAHASETALNGRHADFDLLFSTDGSGSSPQVLASEVHAWLTRF